MVEPLLSRLVRRSKTMRHIRRAINTRLNRPRRFETFNKVFCIGWLKTGTTSFGDAMRLLGFKHLGFDRDVWQDWYRKGDVNRVIRFASHFESFDDLPWNKIEILEALDRAYPASKFVLLERDEQSWIKSFVAHRSVSGTPFSGPVEIQEAVRHFHQRNEFVNEYFRGSKREQLLRMNVIKGDGFEKLCPFLSLPVIEKPFPHANRAKNSR